MNRLSINLGFWSALLSAATFIIFTICFVAILLVNPLFIWTDFADYVAYNNANNQFFKHLAQFMMLLFGLLYVVLLNSIHDYAQDEKKTLSRISLTFGAIFAALIGIHYFLQISVVRSNLEAGQLGGLEQFIQGNPRSAVSGINMLGWSVFLGLSSLFIAPVFSGGHLEKVISYSFLANGVFMLLGAAAFVFDITVLLFLVMNIGMGAAVLLFTISLSVLFGRMGKTAVA